MEELIKKANDKLSRVAIRQKKESLYLRGVFPPKSGDGDKPKQYEISLKCKANPNELKVALAKAKEIESALILEKWQWGEAKSKEQTVGEVVAEYEKYYWSKTKKDINTLYNWEQNQKRTWAYLPEDELFTESLIKKAILSFPANSYARYNFIRYIQTLTLFKGMRIDYKQFGKYTPKKKKLPLVEDIIRAYEEEDFIPHKWIVGVLFTYGLRPHEIPRSQYLFDKRPPLVEVGDETKTKERTVYPLFIPEINLMELEIPELNYDLTLPNRILGRKVSRIFSKYPFSAYQLRHYYAVRGAMEGMSPVMMSKWMGHSLSEHFKSYASLLGDIESEATWLSKFGEN
jgi:integrase